MDPMNEYYAQVGENLAAKFTKPWALPAVRRIVYNIQFMNFRFVDCKEITALINALNESKSSELYGITTKHLKDALKILIVEFVFLINACLDSGIMPNAWCVSTITSVPKNGMSHAMFDYRPISVLPSTSKIIERAVYNQLIHHFESYGLLDTHQHGFRKDHSTCSAIFEFTQYLYDKTDNRDFISCVFIDYSKAFDTIDHEIMCKKLYLYGLGPGVVAWCKDYLSHSNNVLKLKTINHPERMLTMGYIRGQSWGHYSLLCTSMIFLNFSVMMMYKY